MRRTGVDQVGVAIYVAILGVAMRTKSIDSGKLNPKKDDGAQINGRSMDWGAGATNTTYVRSHPLSLLFFILKKGYPNTNKSIRKYTKLNTQC